jgi:flavin reductase
MNRSSQQNEALKGNGVLCVNTLAHGQHELLAIFAGLTAAKHEERFTGAAWTSLKTGAPVLSDALASFDCAVDDVIEVGTHSVFLCSVIDVALKDEGDALVYFRRNYCTTRPLHASQ